MMSQSGEATKYGVQHEIEGYVKHEIENWYSYRDPESLIFLDSQTPLIQIPQLLCLWLEFKHAVFCM